MYSAGGQRGVGGRGGAGLFLDVSKKELTTFEGTLDLVFYL